MSTEVEVEPLVLPTKKVKALFKSPRKVLIFSKPKVGKTSLFAELEKSLILDLENGSDFLDAVKLKANDLDGIVKIGEAIKKQGKPYKYIIVDTITKLEDMCLSLALKIYKSTPIGKTFTGDNVLNLPNGAGYGYLREAFFKMTNYIETLSERTIYLGHLKAKYIEKNGKEVTAAEVDLVGKIKSMLSADVDAIGLMYRSNDNKNMLTFKTTDDVICGARPEHLKNAEFVISETVDGKLKTNLNKIYID